MRYLGTGLRDDECNLVASGRGSEHVAGHCSPLAITSAVRLVLAGSLGRCVLAQMLQVGQAVRMMSCSHVVFPSRAGVGWARRLRGA